MNKSNSIKKILTAAIAVTGMLMMASSFADTIPSDPIQEATPHKHYCPHFYDVKPVDFKQYLGNIWYYKLSGTTPQQGGVNAGKKFRSVRAFRASEVGQRTVLRVFVVSWNEAKTHGNGSNQLTCAYNAIDEETNQPHNKLIIVNLVNSNMK